MEYYFWGVCRACGANARECVCNESQHRLVISDKWWQCSAKVNMNLFKDLFEKFYFLIKFLHVFCASSSSLFSSSSLYFKLADFLRPLSLSKVIGSIMQEPSVLTRLIATYEMPAVFSVWPMSIHAFGSVRPWLLCIVIAQASFNGSCCRSCIPSRDWEVTVIGHIGTHDEMDLLIDGPL